ncbi:hypothetical protein GGR92_004002 [Spirosoma lacussanchae]
MCIFYKDLNLDITQFNRFVTFNLIVFFYRNNYNEDLDKVFKIN